MGERKDGGRSDVACALYRETERLARGGGHQRRIRPRRTPRHMSHE